MPKLICRVSVLAVRRPPVTRWGKGELRPLAVLDSEPATRANTLVTTEAGVETWYLGGRDLVLWSGDTAHHRDNLMSGRPALWVALRGADPACAEVACVTADPYEGEGLASDLALIVDIVPMPAAILDIVADFVTAHHVEMPFKKRKRVPADPDAFTARAPRVLGHADKWEARKGREPGQ